MGLSSVLALLPRWCLTALLLTGVTVGLGIVVTPTMAATSSTYEFSSPKQEQDFRDLMKELRCPKCQNQDIGDSDSELAKDLRDKSFELLQEGKSKKDVVAFMVERYGNFITYLPPFQASTMILWFGPVIVMLIGLLVVVMRTRKKPRNSADNALNPEQAARLSALLSDDPLNNDPLKNEQLQTKTLNKDKEN